MSIFVARNHDIHICVAYDASKRFSSIVCVSFCRFANRYHFHFFFLYCQEACIKNVCAKVFFFSLAFCCYCRRYILYTYSTKLNGFHFEKISHKSRDTSAARKRRVEVFNFFHLRRLLLFSTTFFFIHSDFFRLSEKKRRF